MKNPDYYILKNIENSINTAILKKIFKIVFETFAKTKKIARVKWHFYLADCNQNFAVEQNVAIIEHKD